MSDRAIKAAFGFVAGAIGLAILQEIVDQEARELGIPHVIAGALVAIIAQSME